MSPLDEIELAERRQDEARHQADVAEVMSCLRSLVTLLDLLEESLLDLPGARPRVEVASVDVPLGTTRYRAR